MQSDSPSHKAETLLEYAVLDLGQLKNQTVDALAQGVDPVAVELRGDAQLALLLQLFIRLRAFVPEITWRPSSTKPAVVVFSRLPDDEYIRPHDVQDTAEWWSEEQLTKMEEAWEKEEHKALDIDLTALWQAVEGGKHTAPPLQAFLFHLYSMNPSKRSVAFSGEALPAACLFALNWFFAGGTKEISYNDQPLVV